MPALEILVKGTVLLAMVFGLAAVLRGASAATRHLVWSCGLLGLLVLPLLIVLPWRLPVLPPLAPAMVDATREPVTAAPPALRPETAMRAETADDSPPTAPAVRAGDPRGDPEAAAETATTRGAGTIPFPWSSATGLLLTIWALGTLAIAGRYAAGMASLRRTVARARPVEDPEWMEALEWASDRLLLDARVRLLASDDVPMPLTAGALRPVVVLPSSALGWPVERRRAVLVHELAHVRRKDALAHALTWAAAAAWWFHPMVWMAARRLRAESERACDDLVLRAGTRASSYADHLLEIVSAVDARAPVPAIPLAQRSEFEGRMLRILAPDARRHGLSALKALGMAAAVFALAVPLAAIGMAEPEVRAAAGSDRDSAAESVADHPAEPDPSPRTSGVGDDPRAEGRIEDETRVGSVEIPLLESIDLSSPREIVRDGGRAVVRDGMRDLDIDVEEAAQETGGTARQAPAAFPLIVALGDDDADVRQTAARALGEIDDPRAVEALSRALATDPDAGVRAMAAWALGEIESPAAIPALGRALREDRSADVRKMAAWAMGEIEDPSAIEHLRAGIRDPSPEVRTTVVWALGEIEDGGAVPALAEILRQEENAEIREQAAWALGEIESPAGADALIAALRDRDARVRRKAAWALGELDLEVAPPALIAAASDADPEVRAYVAWALGEIEDPAAVPALGRLVRDSDKKVKKTALHALSEIEAPPSYEVLVEMLQDEDPEVRRAAARALGERN